MSIAMTAEQRNTTMKSELRSLRASGRVPGIVYGKQLASPASVAIQEKELLALLRSHPNAVIDLDIPGAGKQSVMIADVQREKLSRKLIHVDFQQINMNEEVTTHVRIDLVGDSQGECEGGIVQALLHELEVRCLPGSIPDSIPVDVTGLLMGSSYLVGDVQAPAGVTIMTDPSAVLVTVLVPQKDLTAEEAEAQEVEAKEAVSRSTEAQMHEVDFAK
ncbi:50S ribosomal protein L25 [Paenibacillus sp. ATY16]|uniref:50S ribosomal protein L25 n=1 Tax=Paenibacillus sp. ATY16 TaxID=1759312 RepID=UPI00200BBDD9|nr:50S ribosomal protein L25 [Paenibacillus sp. ATY16]MCK9859215.1 50S ribosomal protein L25 [Paenibacillus sp. ATY16]